MKYIFIIGLVVITALSGCSDRLLYKDNIISCYSDDTRKDEYNTAISEMYCVNNNSKEVVCEYRYSRNKYPPEGCYE